MVNDLSSIVSGSESLLEQILICNVIGMFNKKKCNYKSDVFSLSFNTRLYSACKPKF